MCKDSKNAILLKYKNIYIAPYLCTMYTPFQLILFIRHFAEVSLTHSKMSFVKTTDLVHKLHDVNCRNHL